MDKLASRLRHDANEIEVTVSAELDHRIAASLQNVTPKGSPKHTPASRRPALFWWTSSLTGIAAAAVVIILLNFMDRPASVTPLPEQIVADVPVIDWQTETAMLTSPLEQELYALQSDFKKAEKKLRQDIGL